MILSINKSISKSNDFFEKVAPELYNIPLNNESLSIDLTSLEYTDLRFMSLLLAMLANRYSSKFRYLRTIDSELNWSDYISDKENTSLIYMVYLSNMSEYLKKVGFYEIIAKSNAKYCDVEYYGISGQTEKKYSDPKGSRFFILKRNDTIEDFYINMNSYLDNMLDRVMKPDAIDNMDMEISDYQEKKKKIKTHFYEICQNACNHSTTGGIALVETNNRSKKARCAITDYGIGIHESVRITHTDISLVDSLVFAITKRRNYKAYGLFGVINFVANENGSIWIYSNGYSIEFKSKDLHNIGFPLQKMKNDGSIDKYIDCNDTIITHSDLSIKLKEYIESNLIHYKDENQDKLNEFGYFNGVHFEFEITILERSRK